MQANIIFHLRDTLRALAFVVLGVLITSTSVSASGTTHIATESLSASVAKELDSRIVVFQASQLSVSTCVALLANHTGYFFSVESVPCRKTSQDELDKPISLSMQNTTVRHVLDSIVAKNTNFSWSVSGDTISVYPTASRHDPGYLFQKRINNFRAVGLNFSGTTLAWVNSLRNYEPRFGMMTEPWRPVVDQTGNPILFNMTRQNMTAVQILDQIARKIHSSWDLEYNKNDINNISSKRYILYFYDSSNSNPNVEHANVISAEDVRIQKFGPADAPGYANLDTQIQAVKVEYLNVPQCLAALAGKLHFSYNIEAVPNKNVTSEMLLRPLVFSLTQTTLGGVFDALVNENKAYQVSYTNNLLRFYTRGTADSSANPLLLPLPHFRAVGIGVPAATDLLVQALSQAMPGIKLSAQANEVRDINSDPVLVNIDVSGETAQQILDTISVSADCSWRLLPVTKSDSLELFVNVPADVSGIDSIRFTITAQ